MKDFSKDDFLELKDIFDRVPHYCFDDAKFVQAYTEINYCIDKNEQFSPEILQKCLDLLENIETWLCIRNEVIADDFIEKWRDYRQVNE
jgi:hypothetical protein